MKLINWKIFFILLAASLAGVIAIFPYLLTVQKDLFESVPISLPLLITLQLLQSFVLFSTAIFTGLLLSNKVGLTLPLLEAIVFKRNYRGILKSIISLSVPLGFIAGVLIILFDYVFLWLGVSLSNGVVDVPVWQRFLASFYGGITEEVLMRLFLMTLFVWISFKVKRTKQNTPAAFGVWTAIIIAALLFGVGHLPVTAALTELTPLVVIRAIVLNGIGGIIFGWLYWKKGLESAMIAHFSTDITLLIILPSLFSLFA